MGTIDLTLTPPSTARETFQAEKRGWADFLLNVDECTKRIRTNSLASSKTVLIKRLGVRISIDWYKVM